MAALSALKTKLQIQKTLFQPLASWEDVVHQAWRAVYLGDLRKNGQRDDGIVLLKAGPAQTLQTLHHRVSAARARWLEACTGLTGYWEPTGEELDSEVLAATCAA
jgi:hypothetical protein